MAQHRSLFLLGCALLFMSLPLGVSAQDGEALAQQTSVYVTTQDFLSLRTGPGTAFERLTVVKPAVTLPAIGRSADMAWVQVMHDNQAGWLYAGYLVWSGDIVQLTVDGVDTQPFVRRMGVVAVTTRETPLYERDFGPEDYIGTLPADTIVELTGRLGDSGFFRVQILHDDQLYWIGRWNVRVLDGFMGSLLNTNYLYPYGRLAEQLDDDINQGFSSLGRIERVWSSLNEGNSVSCSDFPSNARSSRVSEVDLERETIFAPPANALNIAVERINLAIAGFEDACGRTDAFITERDVFNALATIDSARRALNLANSLLNSLEDRDPVLMPFTDF